MKEKNDCMLVAVLANGERPRHDIPLRLITKCRYLICCDGALHMARSIGREPDLVVGDGDSLDIATRISLGDRIIHITEQETNDLAKAFSVIATRIMPPPDARIAILGATGLREDHSLGNIFQLTEFAKTYPATTIVTNHGVFSCHIGEATFRCEPGEPVSIFAPLPETAVESSGLRWPLKGVDLSRLWAGTLNETTGESFVLSSNKTIISYRPHHRLLGAGEGV